jgi:hypothetical protein
MKRYNWTGKEMVEIIEKPDELGTIDQVRARFVADMDNSAKLMELAEVNLGVLALQLDVRRRFQDRVVVANRNFHNAIAAI